jgi:hypothetical protein
MLLGALASAPAGASSAPPSLPGPPPQAGADLPAAPPSGTVPPAGPPGPATTIPTRVPGPGLLSGTARINGRLLTLAIACPTDGNASLSASEIARGVIARARYKCKSHRAAVALMLSAGNARRLTALGSTVGRVTLGRGTSEQFSLTLAARSTASSYWTDGGLECDLLGSNEPYLVAPNFTVTPPVMIEVRPWVAFYTSAAGWQWLGTSGLNHSGWYEWTASAAGVMQWRTPAGALNPWTWAPISVHAGQGTDAIGAFEVIYWYARPRYVWRYARSRPSMGAGTTFCAYP